MVGIKQIVLGLGLQVWLERNRRIYHTYHGGAPVIPGARFSNPAGWLTGAIARPAPLLAGRGGAGSLVGRTKSLHVFLQVIHTDKATALLLPQQIPTHNCIVLEGHQIIHHPCEFHPQGLFLKRKQILQLEKGHHYTGANQPKQPVHIRMQEPERVIDLPRAEPSTKAIALCSYWR